MNKPLMTLQSLSIPLLLVLWVFYVGGCGEDSDSSDDDDDVEDIVPECESYAKLLCQCNYDDVDTCEGRYAVWRNRTRECLNASGCLDDLADQCISFKDNLVNAWELQCYSISTEDGDDTDQTDGDEIPFFPDGDEEETEEADTEEDGDVEEMDGDEEQEQESVEDGDTELEDEQETDEDGDLECPEYDPCETHCADDALSISVCEWLDHPDHPGCQYPHVSTVTCDEGSLCMEPDTENGEDFEIDCYEQDADVEEL